MNKVKIIFINGFMVLVSLLLGLIIVETCFRIFNISIGTVYINRKLVQLCDNPDLLFKLKRNSIANAEVDYKTNTFCMRNKPIKKAKPYRTKRIAVLGDSIAFGYWVSMRDSFPTQLEAFLNKVNKSIYTFEVLNFSVPGYNLEQEIEWLRIQALQFSPDLILIAMCLNDFDSAFSYEYGIAVKRNSAIKEGTLLKNIIAFALDHSKLCSWIYYRLNEIEVRKAYIQNGRVSKASEPSAQSLQNIRSELEKKLRKLKQIIQPYGNPTALIIFPTFDVNFDKYPNRWLHEIIAQAAKEYHLNTIDLLEPFSKFAHTDVRVDFVHPNPLGHKIAAHSIVMKIDKMKLVRGVKLDISGLEKPESYDLSKIPKVRGY